MPPRARTTLNRPLHGISLFLVALALAALAVPSAAQSESSGTDGDLQDTRERIDDLDGELAYLAMSDIELDTRLADLQVEIDAQQAAAADAVAAVESAEVRIIDLQGDLETTQRWVDTQQILLNERAVAAYVSPNSEGLTLLFESDDYNEFHKMNVMVRQVAEHDRGILEALLEAKSTLVEQEAAAAAARAEAVDLQRQAETALADLEAAKAEEASVRDALLVKIDEVHGEIDSLEASEAELVAIIEERNRAAEAARLAAATTLPPTTAPPTTSAAVGSTPPTSSATTASTAPPVTNPGSGFLWPLSGPVVSAFGPRLHPIDGVVKMHQGIDIDGLTGEPITASAAGEVFYAGWLGGYGNAVLIDHGDGFTSLYAHQSVINVSVGQTVSAGQTVGLVGSTGNSTGPHLHFEIRIWSVPHDPLAYLP